MTRLLALVGIAALTLFAACASASHEARPGEPRGARPRSIAFDNSYGKVTALQVHVTVDGGAEQTYPAACDEKTCTFMILLTNAQHTLLLSVEQEGKRSEVTTIAVDTAADAKR